MSAEMKVYYPGGDPDGVVEVTKGEASMRAIAFPRKWCDDIHKQYSQELKFSGVYVLWSPRAPREQTRIYVGKSDNPFHRVVQWDKRPGEEFKDWTRAVVYTDALSNLNIVPIEAELLLLAREAELRKLCKAANKNNQKKPPQNQADDDAIKRHISGLRRFFLPLAGCDFFPRGDEDVEQKQHQKPQVAKAAPVADATTFQSTEFSLNARGIKARGQETETGFLVYKGSQAKIKESPALHTHNALKRFATMRDALQKDNTLVPDRDNPNVFLFSRDYLFTSPSTAASVVLGANANGRREWRDATNKKRTLGDLQEQKG